VVQRKKADRRADKTLCSPQARQEPKQGQKRDSEKKEVDAYISIKLKMGNRYGEQKKVYKQQGSSTFHAWKE